MKIKTNPVGIIQTNCYLVTDEATGKSVLIDPGARSPQLKACIEGVGAEKITAILLTHGHFDHVTGIPFVRELVDAPVYIHPADAVFLEKGAPNSVGFRPTKDHAPDHFLNDGDTVECGNLTFTLIHTPGHTPGSSCYVCEDVIFSGDTLFYRNIGRADFPYSSYQDELKSIDHLKALPGDYTVYPGHGPSTTMEKERANNPYMNR